MLRVQVITHSDRTRWLWRGDDARAWLAFFDIELVDSKPDVAICTIATVAENKHPRDVPVVCEDFHDACTFSIWRRRALLDHPELAAIFRQIVFRDPQRQNVPFVGTELSLSPFVTMTTGKEPVKHPDLPEATLNKIKLAYPLWATGFDPGSQDFVCEPCNVPTWRDRAIDVMFIGQMKYGQGFSVEKHRRMAWDAIGTMTNRTVLRRATSRQQRKTHFVPSHRFHQLLRMTKFAICPYGWAAWTWRDIEAIASGAIAVKPLCDDQQMVADAYTDNRVCWCKPDFSDLEEVIEKKTDEVLKNESRYIRELPQWLWDELEISRCVSRIAGLLHDAVSR